MAACTVFGRTDFSRIFIFEPPDFFADFLAGFFLLIFVGKVPRKILQENPRENPPKCIQQKSSDTFLQIGRGRKTGKVNFCTGAGRKAFFEFFRPDSGPPPPGTYASTAKKGKFICTGHIFFPHGMAFLEKKGGGGLVQVHVFIFPEKVTKKCPKEFADLLLRCPSAVWLVTGTFATEHRSHLRLRFLVLSAQLYPKDPAVLKILRVVFSLAPCDLLSRHTLCGHRFRGNYRHFPSPRRVRVVVNLGGVVKRCGVVIRYFCYRRSMFSTEGSFG